MNKFFILLLTLAAGAMGNKYMVPGNTYNGDGTTWESAPAAGQTGAYNTLPSTIARDDTLYCGDGTIIVEENNGYLCNDATDGTKKCIIKKATSTQHGTATGWNSDYGDGQIVFTTTTATESWYNEVFYISTDYWLFDGSAGYGSSESGYGIKIVQGTINTREDFPSYLVSNAYGASADHVELRHVAICGKGTSSNTMICVEGFSSHVTIDSCYMDSFSVAVHSCGIHTSVSNSYFKDNWSESYAHGSCFNNSSDSLTIKNNFLINSGNGTGHIELLKFGGGAIDGWKIYNNVVYGGSAGNGFVCSQTDVDYGYFTNCRIYNNTIVATNGRFMNSSSDVGSGNEIKNNIYFNANQDSSYSHGSVYDYNLYNGATNAVNEPHDVVSTQTAAQFFTDSAALDFSLKSTSDAVGTGYDVSSYVATDILNRPRSVPIDIGAYRYDAGVIHCIMRIK